MNSVMLAQHLRTIKEDLKQIHESDCLGCVHVTANRASLLATALIAILEREPEPVFQMQVFTLSENDEVKA